MNLMASAMKSLASGCKSVMGGSIVYRRKDGRSATLTVILGLSERDRIREREVTNIVKTDDILIEVSVFEAAFGDNERPDEGDIVERNGQRYIVRPLGVEPAVRIEQSGVLMRIHLKDAGAL